jgi:ankyrin repeat protein
MERHEILEILRIVEHDAKKLPFRDAMRNYITIRENRMFNKEQDIIYYALDDNFILKYIRERRNGDLLQLIMNGVNIDILTYSLETPLLIAIISGNIEAIKMLIKTR